MSIAIKGANPVLLSRSPWREDIAQVDRIVTYVQHLEEHAGKYNISRIKVDRTDRTLGFTATLDRPLSDCAFTKMQEKIQHRGEISPDRTCLQVEAKPFAEHLAWIRQLAPQKPFFVDITRELPSPHPISRPRLSAIIGFALACPKEIIQVGISSTDDSLDFQLMDQRLAETLRNHMQGAAHRYEGSIKIVSGRKEALLKIVRDIPACPFGRDLYE